MSSLCLRISFNLVCRLSFLKKYCLQPLELREVKNKIKKLQFRTDKIYFNKNGWICSSRDREVRNVQVRNFYSYVQYVFELIL